MLVIVHGYPIKEDIFLMLKEKITYLYCFIYLFIFSAARALDMLNFTLVNNKPIRVMYSNRDPSTRKSGTANIFIKVY